MISQALRACPVCEHREIGPLHTQHFVVEDNHPLGDNYVVAHCRTCGFVYADVAATQADYDAFYATRSKYEDGKTSTGARARATAGAAEAQRRKPTSERP